MPTSRQIAGASRAVLAALALAATPAAAQTQLHIFSHQEPTSDLETAAFTEHVEAMFDLDITFETTTYDPGPAAERRQIMLASGDYPDVFNLVGWVDGLSRAEQLRLADFGLLVPLNGLIEAHAPNIVAAFEAFPALRTLATAPDGNIYAMPQWNDCFHCSYGAKLWINTHWLETLGLDMPRTTEEMRAVLIAFRDQDPNGNGRADEIALSANTADYLVPFFMNAFVYHPSAGSASPLLILDEDGNAQFPATLDAWREGLAYLRGLYEEGLIDTGAFTQNRDAFAALGNTAEAPIVGAATILHPAVLVTLGQEDGRDTQYDAVPPLTGPGGVSYASYTMSSQPTGVFAITNRADEAQQIAAIRLLDYLYTTEGHLLGHFGLEGVDWTQPEPGDVALDPSLPALYRVIQPQAGRPPNNNAWRTTAERFSSAEFRGGQVQPEDIYAPDGYERRLFQATELYAGKEPRDQIFPYWNVWIPADQANDLAQLQTNIHNYVRQANAEFITGQRDIESDEAWQAYVADLERLGVARFVELYQANLDAVPTP